MQTEKKKFYQVGWFLWLWLILFPPIGIILLWTCHKEKTLKSKIILSIVFAIWFIILNGSMKNDSSGSTNTNSPLTTTESESNVDTKSTDKLPSIIDAGCRALTKKFVEGVVNEEYSMLAFNVEEFELDENADGTIKILYFLSDAGKNATKVNLTISKTGGTYRIEYAMLAGLYEVNLEELSKEYIEFVTE